MATSVGLTRVSWQCIHFLALDAAERAKRELADAGALAIFVDGSVIRNEEHLFAEFAAAMEFPDYFGWNWDTFDQCVRDLNWLPAEGYVVFVYHAEQLWSYVPRVAGALAEAWLLAASHWAIAEVSFHLVFVW
ncbi:MAG TPA: barstar family protein [Chloroflexota bacterium]|nr:barstar family protein [Chloroflexota bacterium]